MALAANRLTEMKPNIFEIERKADRISKNQNIKEKHKLLLKYLSEKKYILSITLLKILYQGEDSWFGRARTQLVNFI